MFFLNKMCRPYYERCANLWCYLTTTTGLKGLFDLWHGVFFNAITNANKFWSCNAMCTLGIRHLLLRTFVLVTILVSFQCPLSSPNDQVDNRNAIVDRAWQDKTSVRHCGHCQWTWYLFFFLFAVRACNYSWETKSQIHPNAIGPEFDRRLE